MPVVIPLMIVVPLIVIRNTPRVNKPKKKK